MDEATINEATFTLTAPGPVTVSGSVTYDWNNRTATFDPTADLAPGTLYTATIGASMADLAGNELGTARSWSFTTADPDADLDGYPASADCDDGNETVHPDAAELCNDVDDNCSGEIDEGLSRPTTCGLGICAGNTGAETCAVGSWGGNSCNPFAGATAEIFDGLDNNCNGTVDEGLTPPGLTVTPTAGLVTTEGGGRRRFTVRINTLPAADVTVALFSSDTTEGIVSPASITFTRANALVARTVTVTGVDDLADDGNVAYTIESVATSDDANYEGLAGAGVSLINTDNDAAGIRVSPTSRLVTSEAGGQARFTVRLNTLPAADVTVALASSDNSEGTVSPASLTFTAADWSALQTVTVTGADDQSVDGRVAYTIVTAAAESADANYNGLDPADVPVANADDDTAGFTVTPTFGIFTTEAGGQASFTVRLDTVPAGDVTVALSSRDAGEGTVLPASLTFTAADWAAPQTVIVTGVDDQRVDGTVPYRIVTGLAASSDGNYRGLNPADVAVSNTDDDTAGFTVTPTSGLLTTEAGGTDTFTVALTSVPTANVTVRISSSDPSEGTVSPAVLAFKPGNALTPQTVTVKGVDDSGADGRVAYTIVTAAATSMDRNYRGLDPADVAVANTDDETPGITVTPLSGLVTSEAGGTATFTVVLTSVPTADVWVSLSSSDPGEGTVSPESLTFTPADALTPQTVTVTGVDDLELDGNILYAIELAAESDDARYNGLDPVKVPVTNRELPPLPAVAAITANGAIGNYGLVPKEPLRIDVWLECGSYCDAPAEVWIYADTPAGTRYYDGGSAAWGSEAQPSFTGALGAIAGLRVLDEPAPPAGSSVYTIAVFLAGAEAAPLASASVAVGSAAGFFEDFEDGVADDWRVDADAGWAVGGGVVRVSPRGTTTPPASVTSVRFASYPTSYADFTYSADLRLFESPLATTGLTRGVGLLLRSDGTYDNGYVFHINANGAFTIFKRAGGVTTMLVPWTRSPANCTGDEELTIGSTICTGEGAWNRLEVTALGRDLTFRVNGTAVAAFRETASRPRAGMPGLKAFGGSDAEEIFEFDNVLLRALP